MASYYLCHTKVTEIIMSNYKHFKHYYDPYDSLDVEWQNVVSKGHLTISEVMSLSGYTKSYVYRLVKDGVIPCSLQDDKVKEV